MDNAEVGNKLLALSEYVEEVKEKLNDAEYKHFLDLIKNTYDAVKNCTQDCKCQLNTYHLCATNGYVNCRNWSHYTNKFPLLLRLANNVELRYLQPAHLETQPILTNTENTDLDDFIKYIDKLYMIDDYTNKKMILALTVLNYLIINFSLLLNNANKANKALKVIYLKLCVFADDCESNDDIINTYNDTIAYTDYNEPEINIFKKWKTEIEKVIPNIQEIIEQ